jgi:hypothetical protein
MILLKKKDSIISLLVLEVDLQSEVFILQPKKKPFNIFNNSPHIIYSRSLHTQFGEMESGKKIGPLGRPKLVCIYYFFD